MGFTVALTGAIKTYQLYKIGRVYLRENIGKALKASVVGALTSFMGVIFVILDRFTLFGSVGGIIANIFDIADGRWNGRIKYDIRLW